MSSVSSNLNETCQHCETKNSTTLVESKGSHFCSRNVTFHMVLLGFGVQTFYVLKSLFWDEKYHMGTGKYACLNSKIELLPHPVYGGYGLFAKELIPKGELVWKESSSSSDHEYTFDEISKWHMEKQEKVNNTHITPIALPIFLIGRVLITYNLFKLQLNNNRFIFSF